MSQLGQATPRLLCSLVHKFGRKGVDDFDAFIKELQGAAEPTVASCSSSSTNVTGPRAASCTGR